ncbi:MAG: hypothetical protein MHPSP_004463, partial [Paramarteilia canceri]
MVSGTPKDYLNDLLTSSGLDDGIGYHGIVRKSCIRYLNVPNYSELFPPCIEHDIFE